MDNPSQLQPPSGPLPPTLCIGPRDLIVFAGLPGAGKSTLLGELDTAVPVAVLDSEQLHRWAEALLAGRCPYGVYRGAVHLAHRARIVWSCLLTPTPVLAHEPATRPLTRAMLVVLGMLTRRSRVLVWLHVEPAQALAGQCRRGRLVGALAFARHVRRAGRLGRTIAEGRHPHGWSAVHVFTRADLTSGLRLEVRR